MNQYRKEEMFVAYLLRHVESIPLATISLVLLYADASWCCSPFVLLSYIHCVVIAGCEVQFIKFSKICKFRNFGIFSTIVTLIRLPRNIQRE